MFGPRRPLERFRWLFRGRSRPSQDSEEGISGQRLVGNMRDALLPGPKALPEPGGAQVSYNHSPRLPATSRARTIAPALLRVSSYSNEGTESATTPPPAWK